MATSPRSRTATQGALVALTVALVIVAVLWIIYRRDVAGWFLHITGSNDEAGPAYGFWSGFGGSFLAPQPAILVTAWVLLRHHNCHQRWCLRLGRPVDGTPYVACHKHHPTHESGGRRSVTAEVIRLAREAHLARQAGAT